jgi:hypothetical protein
MMLRRRLLTPGIAAVAGTVIAASVGIRQGWGPALLSEFVVICWVALLYIIGGAATDTGAVLGQRDDERQHLVGLKAARLSLAAVLGAVVGACFIAAVAGYPFWPFEVLAVIIGVVYFIGLRVYSAVGPEESDSHQPEPRYSLLGFRQTTRRAD